MARIRTLALVSVAIAAGFMFAHPAAHAQLVGDCSAQMKQVQTEIDSATTQADKDAASAELAKAQQAAANNDETDCKQHAEMAHEHVKR